MSVSTNLIQSAANVGLGVVLAVLMAVFMGWVLRYAFTENSKREKAYQDLIKSDISDIQEDVRKHDERMAKALSKFEQVHIYQREEHNRMIEVLNKMSDKLSSIRSIEVKA